MLYRGYAGDATCMRLWNVPMLNWDGGDCCCSTCQALPFKYRDTGRFSNFAATVLPSGSNPISSLPPTSEDAGPCAFLARDCCLCVLLRGVRRVYLDGSVQIVHTEAGSDLDVCRCIRRGVFVLAEHSCSIQVARYWWYTYPWCYCRARVCMKLVCLSSTSTARNTDAVE